jgi:hypothetical protein
MNYIEMLKQSITQVTEESNRATSELNKLEEEFSNIKLNPYGITSIDFAKRQELTKDIGKMEGVIMGLTLALERFEESTSAPTIE